MCHHPQILTSIRSRCRLCGGRLLLLLAVVLVSGCAGGRVGDGASRRQSGSAADDVTRPGTTPIRVDFLYAFENEIQAPYYPIEGIGGLAYARDGTLIFCDEKGGRVHALEPAGGEWYLFGSSPSRPYRPVDVRVDGFSILLLDMGSRLLLRYDLNGVFQDRLLSFSHFDPTVERLPTAFDVDVDGRVVFCDANENQVLLLDSFLSLRQTIGEPGSHREQFSDPSGVAFLPDGGFVVADRGNRRLQRYSRLGYFETVIGGEFDLQNPCLTPQGIACDGFGNVFVADPAARSVHVYSRSLSFLFSIGADLGLLAAPEIPIDVAVGPDDLLAVADRERSAILVYRIVYE
ncbi:MAG: NHL repeat-containing protein [bacterium]